MGDSTCGIAMDTSNSKRWLQKKLDEIFQFEVIRVFIRRRNSDQATG